MAGLPVNVYYAKPILPDVSRVLACIYEKEIDFRLIDIHQGQPGVPVDILKLQSKASTRIHVPAFEDGETKLFESRAICRYLVEKYAGRGNKLLLGRDSLERASIEQWLKTEEHSFDPPSWTLIFYLAFAPEMGLEPDRRAMEESEQKLSDVLDVYEQRLSESNFLAGNDFTLADLSHLPNSHYLAKQDLFTSRKNVSRWLRAISDRNSWRKVVETLNLVPVQRVPILAGAVDGGDKPSPPALSQFSRAVQPPVQPASPGQPVQSPTDASRIVPVPAATQPEARAATLQVPSQKTETPAPTGSSSQQGDKPVTQSATTQVPTRSNGTQSSGASSPKQDANGEKYGLESAKDTSQNTIMENVPTQAASNATPTMQGTSEQSAHQTATGIEHSGSTKTGSTQQVTSESTVGRDVFSSEQGINSEKSVLPSSEDTSQKTTKTLDNGSTRSGSNATPGRVVSSPKEGTNGEKSGPQSANDTSQKTTKAMDSESTQSRPNTTSAIQGSEQIARQSATGTNDIGSTKTGSMGTNNPDSSKTGSTQSAATSQPAPGKGISSPEQGTNGERSGIESSNHTSQRPAGGMDHESEKSVHQSSMGTNNTDSSKTGSTQSAATSQATPGKDVSSPEQGTNGERGGVGSSDDTSQKTIGGMDHESTKSGSNGTPAIQGSSDQSVHQSSMGTNNPDSSKTGSTQSAATSQPAPGKGISSPEQGTNGERSGIESSNHTSQKPTGGIDYKSTQSGSNATPAMQGSSEQSAPQASMGTNNTGSTQLGSSQPPISQPTPGQGVSSPEQGTKGEKSGP